MNFKAWDNNEASYGFSVSAFVGFNSLWETMGLHDKQSGALVLPMPLGRVYPEPACGTQE